MRRAKITIGDDIGAQLDAWMSQQDPAPPLTAVVQSALKEFLSFPRRLLGRSPRKPHITPSRKGSGAHDVSVAHDRYLADK